MLASVDGVIGPADEARIPVTDEGLTRGDGAFEVMRLYAGRPFALEDHFARLARSCAGPAAGGGPRRAARRGRGAARAGRAGRGDHADRAHPRRAPDRDDRAAAAPRAGRARDDRPLRADPRARRDQEPLVRRQHARAAARRGGRLRRGAARHAARARAGGADVVVLLGPRRRAADAAARGPDPGLDHARHGSSPRAAPPRSRARSRICAARRRRSSPRRCARCCRSRRSTTCGCRPRRVR